MSIDAGEDQLFARVGVLGCFYIGARSGMTGSELRIL